MNEERVAELKSESLPQLLRQLADQTTTLVRQEIDLAKVELTQKVQAAQAGAVMLGVAGVCALGALGAFTACVILALALVLPAWAAAIIVCVVYAVVALIAAQSAKHKLAGATPVVPEQTAQTVKDDIAWVKTRAQ
jgi:uncharacterized membrane protein YqjE